VTHLVETYREKLQAITYVDTFQNLILRYDQMHEPPTTQELDNSFTSVESDVTPLRSNRQIANSDWRNHGLKDVDPDEEAYFNGDDEDEDELTATAKPVVNGASPIKPLVNYPDDDAEDEMDILASSEPTVPTQTASTSTQTVAAASAEPVSLPSPPERLSEKRRREEDEEDELLANLASSGTKRRASVSSNASTASVSSVRGLRRQKSISSGKDGGGPKKISISLPLKSTAAEGSETE
jgi:protein phosphatase-4 regulatory subunit 3